MKPLYLHSHSEDQTARLGQLLADCLPDRALLALDGTLGAGKTRLVQGLAAACGVPVATVLSPTFTLWNTYHGKRTIHHLDAYRIKDDDEFFELGVEEVFASDALILIEWAERIVDCLPAERMHIRMEVTGEYDRSIRLEAHAAWLDQTLIDIRAQW